jgi:hypothetical protein
LLNLERKEKKGSNGISYNGGTHIFSHFEISLSQIAKFRKKKRKKEAKMVAITMRALYISKSTRLSN